MRSFHDSGFCQESSERLNKGTTYNMFWTIMNIDQISNK